MKRENKDEILSNILFTIILGHSFLFSNIDWLFFRTTAALMLITCILNLIKLNIVPFSDEDKGIKFINKTIFMGRCLGCVGLAIALAVALLRHLGVF
jgi:hypothetical protein